MPTRGGNQVSSRPPVNKESTTQKQNSNGRVVGNKKSIGSDATRGRNQVSCIPCISKETNISKPNHINRAAGTCGLRLPKRSELSAVRFVMHLRSKIAKGLCFVSLRKRRPPTTLPSSGISKQSVIPVDSHRTEAIEDCIEFINSSSSLPRSNSVSANAS